MRLTFASLASTNALSRTKRISRTFHGARHAPWHHRGPLMPSPIKAKCSAKKKCNEKEAWGQTRKERRTKRDPASRAGRERSSASVAGKNSGRCYSWCELSRSGFIMQQHERHSLLSLRLCASASPSPPGADVSNLYTGRRRSKLKIKNPTNLWM